MTKHQEALEILATGLKTLEPEEREIIIKKYWDNQDVPASLKQVYQSGLRKLEPYITQIEQLDNCIWEI